MAKLLGKNIVLSTEEQKLLANTPELVLIPNQEGVFLLIDTRVLEKNEGKQVVVKVPVLEEEKQQVLEIIKKSRLSDLVEGKLENILNDAQKKALIELLVSGKVFVFKLNETYKKGVYRIKDDEETTSAQRGKKDSENALAPEKPIPEYNLDQDGFVIAHNSDKAKELSHIHEQSIKEGFLRGIKSFDGYYYLIEQKLLEHYMKKAILVLNQKEEQLADELAKNLEASQLLTKIICEFLKEDGELLEKKKGHYKYIK